MTVLDRPLEGRRLYFVGIGGAGLGVRQHLPAWGARCGWEARETIFLEVLNGIEVDLGGDLIPPTGFEIVVSTAHAGRIEGGSRAEFLAELSRCAARSSSAALTARRPPPP